MTGDDVGRRRDVNQCIRKTDSQVFIQNQSSRTGKSLPGIFLFFVFLMKNDASCVMILTMVESMSSNSRYC